jgi:hypothetical protein
VADGIPQNRFRFSSPDAQTYYIFLNNNKPPKISKGILSMWRDRNKSNVPNSLPVSILTIAGIIFSISSGVMIRFFGIPVRLDTNSM